MARAHLHHAHLHHHPHFNGVAWSVGGMALFLYLAILAGLHDCVSVVTNLPHLLHH
jgi:hypothetical protein